MATTYDINKNTIPMQMNEGAAYAMPTQASPYNPAYNPNMPTQASPYNPAYNPNMPTQASPYYPAYNPNMPTQASPYYPAYNPNMPTQASPYYPAVNSTAPIEKKLDKEKVKEIIVVADEIIGHFKKAKKHLDKAENWGFLDVFGIDFISDIAKHGKIADARHEVIAGNKAVEKFKKEFEKLDLMESVHVGNKVEFLDMCCDSLFDVVALSKINELKSQLKGNIKKLEDFKAELNNSLNEH